VCLILLSLGVHPEYPLILAANRDEFYQRPSAPAQFWDDPSDLLAGRDLVAGGTWLGLRGSGRWAALTNYREPSAHPHGGRSRGQLVLDTLRGKEAPAEPLSGYNLLYGQGAKAHYRSNRRDDPPQRIEPGIHGLSNHLLDTPWPKVTRGCRAMAGLTEPEALLEMLRDASVGADELLPDTGVGLETERGLSPMFIRTPGYGTRCSTVMRMDRHGSWDFMERRYDASGGFEDSAFQLRAP
jgi:uncharacterized protein with NRDE domain